MANIMTKGLSLNALRVLACVAEFGSFKAAAAHLGVTQSAVSRQIQTLETQLNVRVVQRDNRVHALTPAGQLLAPQLQRIFKQLEELTNKVRASEAADIRTLNIAIHPSLLAQWLAPKLEAFRGLYPHLQLRFNECDEYLRADNAESINQKLLSGEVDLVIANGQLSSKQIHQQALCTPYMQRIGDARSHLIGVQGADESRVLPADHKAPQVERQVQSSAMAMTLAELEHGQCVVPQYLTYQGALPCEQLSDCQALHPLSCLYLRHKEQELAMVAFTNWLAHVATD